MDSTTKPWDDTPLDDADGFPPNLPERIKRAVRGSLAISDNAAFDLLTTSPRTSRRELQFSSSLYPALVRAIRLATENNHDVFYEYFILGILLEEETRRAFDDRGYNWEVVRSLCLNRLTRFPPTAAKKQLPEFAQFSEGFNDWIHAAREVVKKRVAEHQALIIEDFFEAVRGDKELRHQFHLDGIRRLLQDGQRTTSLRPLSEIVESGFGQVLDGVDVLSGKSDTILAEVRGFRSEANADLHQARFERSDIRTDTQTIKVQVVDIKQQTERIEQKLPPYMAMSRVALALSIVASIALGTAVGLLARTHLGVL